MFLDHSLLSMRSDVERLTGVMNNAFDRVKDQTSPWHETFLYEGRWKTFPLQSSTGELACKDTVCRQAVLALRRCVPGLRRVGFSVMAPATHIRPHVGYPDLVLRGHVGLRIPVGDCGIRVGNQFRKWAEGFCLIFDDHVEHESWNRTNADRVVLLFDFDRPLGLGPASGEALANRSESSAS